MNHVARSDDQPDGTDRQPPDSHVRDVEPRLPAGGPWSPPYRRLTIGILLTIAGTAFEALAVATILPDTVDDLGGLGLYGWVFSAFMLTNIVGLAIAGGESDIRGPGRSLVIGATLFVAGLAIGGLAPTMTILIGGRTVQGLGAGFLSSSAYVAIGRGYPPSAKPRMLALVSSAWVIPGLAGPALSGLVAQHIGWRWVFLGLIPPMVGAALLELPALVRIRGSGVSLRDRRRIARAVQLAAGASLLLVGFSIDNLLLAGEAIAAAAVIGWPALRALAPPGTLRAAPGLPAAVATMALLNLTFFGVDAFIPLMLTETRDRSLAFAGLVLTSTTVLWTTGSWLQERLVRQTSRRLLVQRGLALVAIGILLVTMVLSPRVPVTGAIVAWSIAGLGIGLAYATLSLIILETARPGEEGGATASLQLASVLGVALGTGIGGGLIRLLSDGDDASRASILLQNLLMVGVTVLALGVATRLPGLPGQRADVGEPHPTGP